MGLGENGLALSFSLLGGKAQCACCGGDYAPSDSNAAASCAQRQPGGAASYTPAGRRQLDLAATEGTAACSPEVAEFMQRLQQRVDGVADKLAQAGEPLTPHLALRWLTSRGWDVDEAERALAAHAEWRAQYVSAGRILEEEVSRELAAEKAFLQGVDAEGHSVLVVTARKHDMSSRRPEETERLICYVLDNAAAAADASLNPMRKTLCLFDLSGLALRNLDVKALGALFELLKSHYPESLAGLWFLNAPLLFWGAWSCVSPFVDPKTRRKIHFASASTRGAPAALTGAVPRSVLPTAYGGEAQLVPIQQAVAAMREREATQQLQEPASDAKGGQVDGTQGGLSQRRKAGPWWARAGGTVARSARWVHSFMGHQAQRLHGLVQQSPHLELLQQQLQRLVSQQHLLQLRRTPSSRHLEVVKGQLQVAAGQLQLAAARLQLQLQAQVLDRALRVLLPAGGAWLVLSKGVQIARAALRWTFGTL